MNKLLAIGVVLVWIFAGYACSSYYTQPDMYKSYSTKKCVKIIDYKGNEMPCSALTKFKRYNLVHTK